MEKQKRGFALLDEATRKALASRGGKKSHEMGTAYRFTSETGRTAGRKGGIACQQKKKGEACPSTSSTSDVLAVD